MNYDLAKQIKDAGWNQNHDCIDGKSIGNSIGACLCMPTIPTLSELIEACGDNFEGIRHVVRKGIGIDYWLAECTDVKAICCEGKNPEEAVVRLWLALNGK